MQYLAVPILIFGCMISNITQAGIATANDWEKQTIKEDLLSPAASWMIIAGKMLSSFLINAIAMVLILILLVVVLHIQPVHWGAMVGLALLCSLLFISMGTLLGTLFKRRKDVTILSLVFSFPLFFLCSPFVPLAFNGQVLQAIAQFIPTYYAINLLQHAVHGFPLNGSSTMIELGILCSYVFLFMLLSTLVLRRSVVAH
jgi:ABC-type multidrug transport system permease subunit